MKNKGQIMEQAVALFKLFQENNDDPRDAVTIGKFKRFIAETFGSEALTAIVNAEQDFAYHQTQPATSEPTERKFTSWQPEAGKKKAGGGQPVNLMRRVPQEQPASQPAPQPLAASKPLSQSEPENQKPAVVGDAVTIPELAEIKAMGIRALAKVPGIAEIYKHYTGKEAQSEWSEKQIAAALLQEVGK